MLNCVFDIYLMFRRVQFVNFTVEDFEKGKQKNKATLWSTQHETLYTAS